MSDKPIGPGDFVYVARDCCGEWVGRYATVDSVGPFNLAVLRCDACRTHVAVGGDKFARLSGSEARNVPLPWLRKVPPDAQPEDVQREESVNA